ncbi:hypothetical protein [Micromonospora sp. NPDC005173]|uniref:hypothetical protein n=1 Tax=Micromonospora sp. NPDC005173 TaxID=3157165 RepID=UPI0033AFF57A
MPDPACRQDPAAQPAPLAALRPFCDTDDAGLLPSASVGIAEYGPQHATHTDGSAPTAPGACATVTMVNSPAGAFDLRVVAEGVENDRQHAAIAAISCAQSQGLLYGHPGRLVDLRATY